MDDQWHYTIHQTQKHILYKNFLIKPNNSNKMKYKKFRNKLNSLIRVVKVMYYADTFSGAKSNIKQIWITIIFLRQTPNATSSVILTPKDQCLKNLKQFIGHPNDSLFSKATFAFEIIM